MELIKVAGAKGENQRYAGVLVLRALAENAPAVVYDRRGAFFDTIWLVVNDLTVREGTVLMDGAGAPWRAMCVCVGGGRVCILVPVHCGCKLENHDSSVASLQSPEAWNGASAWGVRGWFRAGEPGHRWG